MYKIVGKGDKSIVKKISEKERRDSKEARGSFVGEQVHYGVYSECVHILKLVKWHTSNMFNYCMTIKH